MHVETVSHPWTGLEPYSHSRPFGEHAVREVGAWGGQRVGGPLSTQSPQPPLLPPLLVLPPLLPDPLLLPLPPLLPLLVLPLPPPLLPPPLLPPPASVSVVNVAPPQANDIVARGTISALPQKDRFIRSIESEARATLIHAKLR